MFLSYFLWKEGVGAASGPLCTQQTSRWVQGRDYMVQRGLPQRSEWLHMRSYRLPLLVFCLPDLTWDGKEGQSSCRPALPFDNRQMCVVSWELPLTWRGGAATQTDGGNELRASQQPDGLRAIVKQASNMDVLGRSSSPMGASVIKAKVHISRCIRKEGISRRQWVRARIIPGRGNCGLTSLRRGPDCSSLRHCLIMARSTVC